MTQVIEILQQCREQLQECISAPYNMDKNVIEEISQEFNVAVAQLKELKEAEEREIVLSRDVIAVKHLPNKMDYSNIVKEMAVVKKRIKELSNEINHSIRNHPEVLNNRKRVGIEIDRLDDILRASALELSEFGDIPTLREETQDFLPLPIARENALTKLKTTIKSLEEVRETLHNEKHDHRELVYKLKTEIKNTRADIVAMENGTYAPAVEFTSRLEERQAAQTSELDGKRRVIEDEIEQLQSNIAKEALVHDANVFAFQAEKMNLEQKLAGMAKDNSSSIHAITSTLEQLQEEHAENYAVLQQLEKRLADEKEEEMLCKQEEDKRLQEAEAKNAMEEKMYYAALWIQLRWKAYLKRKALKQSSKGKKGKKKGKKSKKK
ncbi:hypothetical protein ACHAXR_012234 [Thalassiosira sp. AJA248-18]